jgi:hypothetical protein
MIDNDALPFGGGKTPHRRELKWPFDTFLLKNGHHDHKPVRDWWYPYDDDWFLRARTQACISRSP